MRNICSLFFYELLNVIKVTNQILGESISSRVKVGCSKVKKVCWLCCNSWQSWTGESHVSTFSFHRTLRHWASFCNDWGGLRRAHEGRITAWRHQPRLGEHCQGQGAPGLQMASGEQDDGSWHSGLCQYDKGFPTTLRHDHGHFNCPCFKER